MRGWDDPRMPTISGLRRRGFPAEGIRDFATEIGVSKADSVHEIELLEHAVRAVLNRTAPRRFGVLDPLKVVITNYPEGQVESMEVVNNPEDPSAGTRQVAFGRELWIERDDFMEEPVPEVLPALAGARGAAPDRVLRHVPGGRQGRRQARVVELRCTYDPATRGGDSPDGRKVKATLHWVSAAHAVPAEVRLYDHLFTRPDPGADGDLFADLNPASETIVRGAMLEPALAEAPLGETVQFERLGYFAPDADSRPGALGVQPDADAQGLLGEGAGQGLTAVRDVAVEAVAPRGRLSSLARASLARGLTVWHLTLDQGVPGSNPGAPANSCPVFVSFRSARPSPSRVPARSAIRDR